MDSVFFIKLLQFILSISLLVLLHEGGHFFFSKLFGVRVNRFYIFFNPKFHLFSTYDKWFRKLMRRTPVEVPVKVEKAAKVAMVAQAKTRKSNIQPPVNIPITPTYQPILAFMKMVIYKSMKMVVVFTVSLATI